MNGFKAWSNSRCCLRLTVYALLAAYDVAIWWYFIWLVRHRHAIYPAIARLANA